ncbi:MAG: permease prefix domain 1-containing protein, partial [Eubacterium aggregans]
METLLNYLDNLFASLPDTEAVRRAKSDLQDSMEERYNELKSAGKSENEAIGTVISEFGNIDELKQLFSPEPEPESRFEAQKEGPDSQSAPETPPEDRPVVDIAMADEYLEVSRKTDMMVGMGVFLCIVSPALLILMATLMPTDLGGILGLIPLFIGVAIGVALFIFADHLKEPYKYLNSAFIPDPEMITWVVE